MPDPDGKFLLRIARDAIAGRLGLARAVPDGRKGCGEPGATFVTLRCGGSLRGCIGSIDPHRPLEEDVRANALSAAFADPRFPPLRPDEYPKLSIEVSLLSPLEPITFADEEGAAAKLRPRIDGLVLECDGRRSTFLPQVWESLAEPREFLAQLKAKAGLDPSFWSPNVRLYRYTVRRWKEKDE